MENVQQARNVLDKFEEGNKGSAESKGCYYVMERAGVFSGAD